MKTNFTQKIINLSALLLCISTVAAAQDLPKNMKDSLELAKSNYQKFAKNYPAETIKGRKDPRDDFILRMMIFKIDAFEIFIKLPGGGISKNDIKNYRLQTIKDLAEVFSTDQLNILMERVDEISGLTDDRGARDKIEKDYFSEAIQIKQKQGSNQAPSIKIEPSTKQGDIINCSSDRYTLFATHTKKSYYAQISMKTQPIEIPVETDSSTVDSGAAEVARALQNAKPVTLMTSDNYDSIERLDDIVKNGFRFVGKNSSTLELIIKKNSDDSDWVYLKPTRPGFAGFTPVGKTGTVICSDL